jgi:predicted  nucleic acid-binding Zn-ribbon protein
MTTNTESSSFDDRYLQLMEAIAQTNRNITSMGDRLDTAISQEREAIAEVRDSIVEVRGSIAEVRGSIAEVRGSLVEVRGSIVELRQITESNARSIAANSDAIAASRQEMQANVADLVRMITTSAEQAEIDRVEFRATVQQILEALTRRFTSNGH